jgi:hypothetical protein
VKWKEKKRKGKGKEKEKKTEGGDWRKIVTLPPT